MTDATTGVTLTSPSPVTPTANQQFKNVEQPITLTVKNAVTSGTTALVYTFEVATDSAFASKVYTKDGVPPGATTTALKIDKLTANKSYFWRARAQSGSLAGPNTEVRGFGIGPEVVLNQPVNGDPQPNATVGEQPTLNVNNVGRSGPNGPIFYRFEISETSAFGSLVYTATVAERTDLSFTGHAVTIKLAEKTYFWRVIATDPANAVTSAASAVSAMKVQPFNLQQATILDSPDNFAFFAETAKITDAGDGTERHQRRLHQEERTRSLARHLPAGILWTDSGTALGWRGTSTATGTRRRRSRCGTTVPKAAARRTNTR